MSSNNGSPNSMRLPSRAGTALGMVRARRAGGGSSVASLSSDMDLSSSRKIMKVVRNSTQQFANRKAIRDKEQGFVKKSKFAPPPKPADPHFAIDVASLRYTATALTPRQCRARLQQDTMRQPSIIRDDSGVAS